MTDGTKRNQRADEFVGYCSCPWGHCPTAGECAASGDCSSAPDADGPYRSELRAWARAVGKDPEVIG